MRAGANSPSRAPSLRILAAASAMADPIWNGFGRERSSSLLIWMQGRKVSRGSITAAMAASVGRFLHSFFSPENLHKKREESRKAFFIHSLSPPFDLTALL